jgi:hypothetical protein
MVNIGHFVRQAVQNHKKATLCLNRFMPLEEVLGLISDWFREFQDSPLMVRKKSILFNP